MSVDWNPEPIAVPLAAGIDVNTRARLVEPTKLLKAKNCYFPRAGGPEKRKGHTASTVRFGETVGFPPDEFLYGWGMFSSEEPSVFGAGAFGTPSSGLQSSFPNAGPLIGTAERDNERVAWDGYRLYSQFEGGWNEPKTAFMPVATSEAFGKTQQSQAYCDVGDNGTIRVLAYRDLLNATVLVKVYDSVTGALKFFANSNSTDPEYIRVVPSGNHVQVFISDNTEQVLHHIIVHNDDTSVTEETVGTDAGFVFDVTTCPDGRLLLVYLDIADDIRLIYFNANGTEHTLGPAANTQLVVGGDSVIKVAVDVHPLTEDIGIVYATSSLQRGRIFDSDGVPLSSVLALSSDANCAKVGCCAAYLTNTLGYSVFYTYSDNTLATNRFVRMRAMYNTAGGSGEGGGTGRSTSYGQRFNVNLVSRPWRVGNVPFVITCFPSDFQTSYLILDYRLYPVGKLEYGTAVNNTADTWCFSVNQSDDYNFHCGLMYKTRVIEQDGIFHEIGVKYCTLDFMPEFRRAQAGRCLYFPGAQLSAYDGETFVESGFHFAVEDPTLIPSNSTGALTNSGEYNYRIYLCRKNAAGEEVRGPAFLTESVTLGASDDTVTITGATIPTGFEGAYFLIYRQANTGTLWYLVSERDPSSTNCPKNDLTSVTWTFVDTLSDVDIASRELDPANAPGFLSYYAAPATEVISYGKDRLWLAGGELPKGTLLPSRLFFAEEAPAFHGNLAFSVDRDSTPITAVGFTADFLFAFKQDKAYIVSGDAADNTGLDDSLRAQLVLSDVGCISHNSVVRLTSGIAFQAEGGIRLVDASGLLRTIGIPVDPVTTYVTDATLDTVNRLVKFYQADADSLVFDYEGGQWTTWTVRTLSGSGNSVVVGDKLWTTSEGYQDGDTNYVHLIKTAHIGPVLGGFNRIRRLAALGESDANYEITLRTYLDENTVPSEEWTFDASEFLNTSVWGDGNWGDGDWGDSEGDLLFPRDSIWKWRHRLAKQKCSCIAVEIEYNGSSKGPIHNALIFETGSKTGIIRR